ncbi:MAG TPA: hypothetical protein VN229_13150, partial [Terriglobales bacterium]|nr:hypothetical protein [Terriglobales bacterium]
QKKRMREQPSCPYRQSQHALSFRLIIAVSLECDRSWRKQACFRQERESPSILLRRAGKGDASRKRARQCRRRGTLAARCRSRSIAWQQFSGYIFI